MTSVNDCLNISSYESNAVNMNNGYLSMNKGMPRKMFFDICTMCLWRIWSANNKNGLMSDDSYNKHILGRIIGNILPIDGGEDNRQFGKRFSLMCTALRNYPEPKFNGKFSDKDFTDCTENYISLLYSVFNNSEDSPSFIMNSELSDIYNNSEKYGKRTIMIGDAFSILENIAMTLLDSAKYIRNTLKKSPTDKINVRDEKKSSARSGHYSDDDILDLINKVYACDALLCAVKNKSSSDKPFRFDANNISHLFFKILSKEYPLELMRDSTDPTDVLRIIRDDIPDIVIFSEHPEEILDVMGGCNVHIDDTTDLDFYCISSARLYDMRFNIHFIKITDGKDAILNALYRPKHDFITAICTEHISDRTLNNLVNILGLIDSIKLNGKNLYTFVYGNRSVNVGLDHVTPEGKNLINELLYYQTSAIKGLYNLLIQMNFMMPDANAIRESLIRDCKEQLRFYSKILE